MASSKAELKMDEKKPNKLVIKNESNIYHTVDALLTFMKEKNEGSLKSDEEMRGEQNRGIEKGFEEKMMMMKKD